MFWPKAPLIDRPIVIYKGFVEKNQREIYDTKSQIYRVIGIVGVTMKRVCIFFMQLTYMYISYNDSFKKK